MMKMRFSAWAGASVARMAATDRIARRTRMARSLGIVMNDPENAAESVKTALTVQANLARGGMAGAVPDRVGAGCSRDSVAAPRRGSGQCRLFPWFPRRRAREPGP